MLLDYSCLSRLPSDYFVLYREAKPWITSMAKRCGGNAGWASRLKHTALLATANWHMAKTKTGRDLGTSVEVQWSRERFDDGVGRQMERAKRE